MKSMVFLLCVFFVLLSSKAKAQQFPWVGFRLSELWGPGYCHVQGAGKCDKTKLVHNFTVHGLWPYDRLGRSLPPCKGPVFQSFQDPSFVRELDKSWPSFNKVGTNENFWKHEWNTHGMCSNNLMNQDCYFTTTLGLNYKHDLLKTLDAEGIMPDDRSYTVQNIIQAIKLRLYLTPQIVCKKNSANVVFLYEIYLCTDQRARALVNCNVGSPATGCGALTNSVKFSSVSSVTLLRNQNPQLSTM